ncbi:MAG TPA: PhaM family polyhydroxyalkanoate granule multifunctional regulatory protein, partial [Rubrivivax sp.]|nr:PhaM family polyhydroxyalkanoate granule multifunctional regulatory protein [Rubrivivax sp.]
MANPSDLTRLVPGFEFLQNLMKGAGAGIPGMSQWIAPTINPEELEKRISELKTVQFWLENNARLLATTIQALEVQRMTLNTLQTMNLSLADLGDALKINLPKPAAGRPAADAEEAEEEEEQEEQEEQEEGDEAEDT